MDKTRCLGSTTQPNRIHYIDHLISLYNASNACALIRLCITCSCARFSFRTPTRMWRPRPGLYNYIIKSMYASPGMHPQWMCGQCAHSANISNSNNSEATQRLQTHPWTYSDSEFSLWVDEMGSHTNEYNMSTPTADKLTLPTLHVGLI